VSLASFDAVVIAAPTFLHAELAKAAANAHKHIFLEKPMALSLAECDAITQAVEANSVVLQLGFMRHFSPEFVAAEELIRAGEIGQPMLVKSLTHGPGLPPAWARDLKTSNGNLAEVNSHDWDTIRWLARSNYHRVYAETSNIKGRSLGVDTENFYDNALVNVRMENGSLCSISSVCPCNYGYDARVEVIGDKGILQIGDLKGQPIVMCNNRDQGLVTPIFRTWPERFEWGYLREMQHFVECVRTGGPPKVGGEDGKWAVAGVLAATRSFLQARPVYLHEILN
jgi:myo-inositol 2-dehydrogenase/D-chiro-inositol 1-dehydrogenase/scyllo-inositol 2-dehydrogenase (NAD+)